MDNNTASILNQKCQLFNALYHTRVPQQNCLSARVSDQYMCPNVGEPQLLPPLRGCFAKQALLGSHHVCETPPTLMSKQQNDPDYQFLPERLNAITKDGVVDRLKSLQENPDFVYSANLIKKGGNGLKKYVMSNGEMFGGGEGIIDRVKGTFKNAENISKELMKKLNKMTIEGAIEEFSNYYTTGQIPSFYNQRISNNLNKIQRDGRLYGTLVGDTLGDLTIGDILSMGYLLSGHKEFNTLSSKISQTGGMMYKIATLPIYDDEVYTKQVVELFDSLKSTINYIVNIFKNRMQNNGVPSHVLEDVDRIQKGLNMCLQIIQYDMVMGKKKLQN